MPHELFRATFKTSKITPEVINELKANEIFVFGSNIAGLHLGGAAQTAHLKFGAEWGVGEGPQEVRMLFRQCT